MLSGAASDAWSTRFMTEPDPAFGETDDEDDEDDETPDPDEPQ
jgi:hypothetical protein